MSLTPAGTAIRVLGISVMMATMVTVATPAGATEPKRCTPVRLFAAGRDLGPDANGIDHTQATVSLLGVPIATTNAAFTFSGPPVGSSQAFTGPIVFTPRIGHASLTAQVTGVVDFDSGAFTTSSTTVSGTGTLAAVSGQLTIRGTENLLKSTFTETITGSLCLPTNVRSTARSPR